MKHVSLERSVLALIAIAAVAISAFGCSKKLTVDSTYTTPEGVPSPNSKLIVYNDSGLTVYAQHESPPGSKNWITDSTQIVHVVGPNKILATLLDGTGASGFQILRKESGGGFAPLKDFPVTPVAKWLDGHWEAYQFHDDHTTPFVPETYIGRGLRSGVVTPQSPLTNPATLENVNVTKVGYTGFLFTTDSLFTISWTPVPGATDYWIQIFNFGVNIVDQTEKFPYGVPAPITTGKIHTFMLAHVVPPTNVFIVGSTPAIHYEAMLGGLNYRVRVCAVDGAGRMIACTGGDPDTVLVGNESFIYSLSAEKVCVGCQKAP
jgi:hypothetical protein